MTEMSDSHEVRFQGIGVSGGAALGKAAVVIAHPGSETVIVSAASVQTELEKARLLQAIERSSKRLDEIIEDVAERVGAAEAMIFKVQQTIMGDATLIKDILTNIDEDRIGAEQAVSRVLTLYELRISELDDEYVRECGSDIAEIRQRLLDELNSASALGTRPKPGYLSSGV